MIEGYIQRQFNDLMAEEYSGITTAADVETVVDTFMTSLDSTFRQKLLNGWKLENLGQDDRIVSVVITNPGSGYSKGNILHGTGNKGIAIMVDSIKNGALSTFTVTTGGTDYVDEEVCATTSDGSGTGATIKVKSIDTGGIALTAELVASGSGYAVDEILTLIGSVGDSATVTVTAVKNGVITGVSILSGGYSTIGNETISTVGIGDENCVITPTFDVGNSKIEEYLASL